MSRVWLTLAMDNWSRKILGFFLSMGSEPRLDEERIIDSISEDKEKLHRYLDVPFQKSLWPRAPLPFHILIDEEPNILTSWEKLEITVVKRSAYLHPLKSLTEDAFNRISKAFDISEDCKDSSGGNRDYQDLTVHSVVEIGRAILAEINRLNERRLESHLIPNLALVKGVEPVPNVLFTWGIENVTGARY